jgi:hypothetical protein
MKEKELFEFLKQNYLPDLTMSEEAFSHWDCFSAQHAFEIELKCRLTHYDELLIEKIKYDALMARAAKYQTNPIYINSTPKGIWVFRIAGIKIEWIKKQLPATTEFKRRHWVEKEVGFIHIRDGKELGLRP